MSNKGEQAVYDGVAFDGWRVNQQLKLVSEMELSTTFEIFMSDSHGTEYFPSMLATHRHTALGAFARSRLA
jgi:hypothetical protein